MKIPVEGREKTTPAEGQVKKTPVEGQVKETREGQVMTPV
jgi:hypothetical protein